MRSETLEDVQQNFNKFMDARESNGYQVYPGTETDVYDFTAERQNMRGTNIIEAIVHLVKSCLGAGILSIHVGFMYAGLWTAMTTTVLVGMILFYTMTLLIRSAHKMYVRLRVPRLSYADLAEMAVATGPWKRCRKFSKIVRYLVDFCVVSEKCGSCCIYEIMIAKTVKQFSESISSTMKDADINLRYYILIAAGPLVILSVIRNVKYMVPFSFLADGIIAICVVVTMYYSFLDTGHISERPVFKNVGHLIQFFGVCLYSLGGMTVVLPIENNMRKPKYYFLVLQYGVPIAVLLITCTGFIGYWGWGKSCNTPITLHMPADTLPLILQCLIAIMLSVTFAVNFWVPSRVIWFYIGRLHQKKRGVWEKIYRILNVVLITAISVAFPNIMGLIIFMGNFFISLEVFIFPAIIDSLVTWEELPQRKIRWPLLRNLFIIGMGLFLCGGAFYSTINL